MCVIIPSKTTEAREENQYEQDYEDLRQLAEDSGFYPKLARVIGFEDGIIIVEDSQGFTWGLFADDYGISVHNGDYVAILMHDNGTKDNIFDDIQLDADR